MTAARKYARASLGFTESVGIKLPPELRERLRAVAARRYQTEQEVIRQAILLHVEAEEARR